MDGKDCLSCKFGSVRVDILVPESYNISRFAQETQSFTSELMDATGKKTFRYALKFDSEQKREQLDFKIGCSCLLNLEKKTCPRYSKTENVNCPIEYLAVVKPDRRPLGVVSKTI
jgi:hypothetical protein